MALKYAPAETRRLLRDRFARYLPSHHSTSIHPAKNVTLSDESLLHLLLNLSIDFESDLARARASYKAALPPNSSTPSLDDLVTAGWIRVVWGRISTPFDVAQAALSEPATTTTAFASLLSKRHEIAYRVDDPARTRADLASVITAIDQGKPAPRDIVCQTPEWVAARLWDRPLTDNTDSSAALRVWVDRWNLLGCPSLVTGHAWKEAPASAFREAALNVLGSDPGLVDWNEMRVGIFTRRALASNQSPSVMEGSVPPVPATLVDRAIWLDDPGVERALMGTLEACGDIFGLVRLLLEEVQAEDNAPAPHKIASSLFALMIERPELLFRVLISVRWSPELLADLLLYPPTSVLACLLIGQWRSPSGAWDRELSTRDDRTTKAIAFADAVSVMGHFLELGSVHPEEVASLHGLDSQKRAPGSHRRFGEQRIDARHPTQRTHEAIGRNAAEDGHRT